MVRDGGNVGWWQWGWRQWGWRGLTSFTDKPPFVPQVHVNLLLLEARMQAALLYALRAITRYMT